MKKLDAVFNTMYNEEKKLLKKGKSGKCQMSQLESHIGSRRWLLRRIQTS